MPRMLAANRVKKTCSPIENWCCNFHIKELPPVNGIDPKSAPSLWSEVEITFMSNIGTISLTSRQTLSEWEEENCTCNPTSRRKKMSSLQRTLQSTKWKWTYKDKGLYLVRNQVRAAEHKETKVVLKYIDQQQPDQSSVYTTEKDSFSLLQMYQ